MEDLIEYLQIEYLQSLSEAVAYCSLLIPDDNGTEVIKGKKYSWIDDYAIFNKEVEWFY